MTGKTTAEKTTQLNDATILPDAELNVCGHNVRLFFAPSHNMEVVSKVKQILIQSAADRKYVS